MNRINHSSRFIEMFGNHSRKPLSDFATSWDKGQPFKKDSIIANGAHPCIHYGELYKYGPVIDKVVSLTDEVAIKKSKNGDILFPASDVTPCGLARCSALMADGVLLGGDIIVLRISNDNSPEYVSYAINMQQDQLIRRVTGSVVRHMSAKSLKTVDIPFPSFDAQLQFVSLFRQADKSKFNGFKSRFIEMFSSEPKMSLSEVSKITMGSSPDSKYYNLEKQGLPFYQGKTEFGEMYIGEASVYCKEPVRIAEPGDILMSVRAPVGTVNFNVIECCIGRGLASIRPKRIIEPLYLFYALRLKEADIDALGTGSTFKAINKDSLFSFKIEVGDKAQQNEFVHFAEQADKSKYLN